MNKVSPWCKYRGDFLWQCLHLLPMEKKPVKFAVVGCGRIGNRHATLIQMDPDCELVALCDIKSEEETGWENSNVPYFNDIKDLLDSGLDFEVVNICTPNGIHAEQALQALEKSKHVVIEKPMGLNKASCERVIFKAFEMSRQVFIVMQNRYSPPSAWLKEMILEERLGRIHTVQINCYWNRGDDYYARSDWKGSKELDGGVLFTQFSHFIDIMYWIFGDITDIKSTFSNFAHAHNTEFEDSGTVTFTFLDGSLGSLIFTTGVWGKNMESSITVTGAKGSIKVGGQYMDKVEYCHVENYEMPELPPTNPPNDYGPYKGSAANHIHVFKNVAEVLRGEKKITTNALEGMKVTEIIERMYQAG